jgi:Cyclic nucleotide-binding domain
MQKGEPGDTFFIVEAGVCVVEGDAGSELVQLGPTAFFGELSVLRNDVRAATVRALTDVNCLTLTRCRSDSAPHAHGVTGLCHPQGECCLGLRAPAC